MEDALVRTRVCPSYMNAACFIAATWHTDADGNEAVEDYKGQGSIDRPNLTTARFRTSLQIPD